MRRLVAFAVLAVAFAPGSAHAKGPPVRAKATLTPRTVLFGDTVTAEVDAVVDPKRVDPARLRLTGDFAPYDPSGPVQRSVQGGYVRLTLRLRCWTTGCLADPKRQRLVFPQATLVYGSGSLRVRWPSLERYSRLDPVNLARGDPRAVAPWRGDETATPPVSYTIDPGLLEGLLLGAAVVLLAAAALLGLRLVPQRRFSFGRRSQLAPLERALLVLEAAWARSAADQRKALELLAAELDVQGQPPLAGQARELAWSQTAPEPGAARILAASVRDVIGTRANGRLA